MNLRAIQLSRCQKCGEHITLARFVPDYVCPRCRHCRDEHEAEDVEFAASLDTGCLGAPVPVQETPFYTAMREDEYARGHVLVQQQERLS